MKIPYVFFGIATLLWAITVSGVEARNFGCSSVANDAELTVCSNRTLSALDTALSKVLKKPTGISNRESNEVRILRKQLSGCDANISCLVDVYETAIFHYSAPKMPLPSLMGGGKKKCSTSGFFNNCQGTYAWKSGAKYTGSWKNDKRHELGIQVTANDDVIIGFWENNVLNGKVKIKFASGKTYIGTMKVGNYYGDATVYDRGVKFVGTLTDLDGSQIFKGTQTFFDGTYVLTQYRNLVEILDDNLVKNRERLVTSNLTDCAPNVFHNCYGTYTWDTGEKYVGEWPNRMRVGNGVFTYKNGNRYTGSWKSNVPDGQGSLLGADGRQLYVGQWIDGQYQQPSQTQNIRNEAKNTDKNVKLSNDKSRQLYQVLASNRWTLGGMPCDYNGGTYIEYNGKFKYGQRLTANGAAAAEGDAPASSVFTENLDSGDPASGYLVLKYEAYPPKRLLNMGFPTGEKTAFGVRNISFDGTTLTEVHSYQTLNLQVFLTSNKVVYEPIKQEKVVRVKCSN